jgi:hypothetical protein
LVVAKRNAQFLEEGEDLLLAQPEPPQEVAGRRLLAAVAPAAAQVLGQGICRPLRLVAGDEASA